MKKTKTKDFNNLIININNEEKHTITRINNDRYRVQSEYNDLTRILTVDYRHVEYFIESICNTDNTVITAF